MVVAPRKLSFSLRKGEKMSEQMMYQVRFEDGRTVLAPSQELAEMIAGSMNGSVEEMARKQAVSLVRAATAAPDFPPRFSALVANVKQAILIELAREEENSSQCSYEFVFRRDTYRHAWGVDIMDRATGKKTSVKICKALWEDGRNTSMRNLRMPK